MNNVCQVIFSFRATQVMNLLSHTDSQLELNNRNEGNDEKLSWLIEKRCFLVRLLPMTLLLYSFSVFTV